jgi:hypothetical protein
MGKRAPQKRRIGEGVAGDGLDPVDELAGAGLT